MKKDKVGDRVKKLETALKAIRDYGKSGTRSSGGYPSEIVYDEFAYKRIVDAYRRAAKEALSKS